MLNQEEITMKKYRINVNGTIYEVEVEEIESDDEAPPAVVKTEPTKSAPPPKAPEKKPPTTSAPAAKSTGAAGSAKINAPMPGNILKINVSVGQSIKKGDVLCILEAMKMENEIASPIDATVASVNVNSGVSVNTNDLLFTLN
jgi:glutaconyl-CoA decarboxylase